MLNTNIKFSEEEIINELTQNPTYFSPNVILRPLYQEIILPNLAYIGGGGEIAYWLELKQMFQAYQVPFPMLMLRNSVLLLNDKQQKKLRKLQLSYQDIFLKNAILENEITRKFSEIPIDFSSQRAILEKQFQELYQLASQTDASFRGAVKAQKKKYKEQLERVLSLRVELFPKESLQERVDNFSEYMIDTRGQLIDMLVKNLNPFDFRFVILSYESASSQGACIEYFV